MTADWTALAAISTAAAALASIVYVVLYLHAGAPENAKAVEIADKRPK